MRVAAIGHASDHPDIDTVAFASDQSVLDYDGVIWSPAGLEAEYRDAYTGAAEAGEIVHVDGTVMGRHPGVIHYTVGQRRGLGVATGDPLYVVRLDADRRQVVVGPREALETHRLLLRDVNWLGDTPLEEAVADGLQISARVRSTRSPSPATVFAEDGEVRVELHAGEGGVAPGQACVFYESDDPHARVLGGGFIARAERPDAADAMIRRIVTAGVGAETQFAR